MEGERPREPQLQGVITGQQNLPQFWGRVLW